MSTEVEYETVWDEWEIDKDDWLGFVGEAANTVFSRMMSWAVARTLFVLTDKTTAEEMGIDEDCDPVGMGYLPSGFSYNPTFALRFAVAVSTMGYKLTRDWPPPPSCVAEELAFRAIMEEVCEIGGRGTRSLYAGFMDAYVEDTDYEMLFHAEEGISDPMTWFEPFFDDEGPWRRHPWYYG